MKTFTGALACLVCISVCIAVSTAQIWVKCPNTETKGGVSVTTAVVPGCSVAPCKMPRGTNQSVTVTFTANADFDDLTVKLCGQIGPTCVDFPLSQNDLCKLGVTCPVKQGSTNTFKFTVDVKKLYPPILVTAQITILDKGGDDEFCIALPIQLV